jgi:hypothetical protein
MRSARLTLVSAVSVILGSCSVYEREITCQREAGPKPYRFADMFGPIGRMAAESTHDRLAWDAKVAACKLHRAETPDAKPATRPKQHQHNPS